MDFSSALTTGLGGSLVGRLFDTTMHYANNDPSLVSKFGASTVYSDAALSQYFKDYDKAISDYFMNKQMDYNKYMSNTAYQRAVADMRAAGLNPASMSGMQASAAGSPAVNANYHSGVQAINNPHPSYNFDSIFSSAINGMLAKDRDAAKYVAREVIDNARHEHRMEESRERREYDVARTQESYARGRYYDRLKSDDKALREQLVEDQWMKDFNKRHK